MALRMVGKQIRRLVEANRKREVDGRVTFGEIMLNVAYFGGCAAIVVSTYRKNREMDRKVEAAHRKSDARKKKYLPKK